MKSLAKRVIKQIIGDKRSIMMILVAPLIVLTLLYLLLGNSGYFPKIAIHEKNLPPALVSALKAQDVKIADISSLPSDFDASQYLKDHKDVDAIFSVSQSGASIYMFEASSKSGAAMTAIKNAMSSLNPSSKLETHFVYGKVGGSVFDSYGYILVGIFSFFLIFILSGIALVRERSSGTLERFLMTPIKRSEVIGGYTAGYSVFAVIQAVLIVVYSIYVLGLHCEGNVGWVILSMLLMAIAAVCFGAAISVFANSEFQVVQLIPIVLIPQIFFSGLIPLDTIPYGLGNLCYITPLYYGCTAIKEVMVTGAGFDVIWPFLLSLLAYTLVLSSLNTIALKKYRKL